MMQNKVKKIDNYSFNVHTLYKHIDKDKYIVFKTLNTHNLGFSIVLHIWFSVCSVRIKVKDIGRGKGRGGTRTAGGGYWEKGCWN